MKIFDLVDEAIEIHNSKQEMYKAVEVSLINAFSQMFLDSEEYLNTVSRIKTCESIKGKIIRKKYYLTSTNGKEILDNFSDLIGITLLCRFKIDEDKMFEKIRSKFTKASDGIYTYQNDDQITLNFDMNQPQKQKNGLLEYRIDGSYHKDNENYRFELQIKSLINDFWSGIEHEIIYKNNNYLLFDSFLKELLYTIKNNLETIDYQLMKVHQYITQKEVSSIGMDGNSFKAFLAKSINDLFSFKLIEAMDLSTDIKKISALLSQYIYVENFLKSENPQLVMIDYFERIDLLSNSDIDFTKEINLSVKITSDKFVKNLSEYIISNINVDFDWHVFFVMLFLLQSDDIEVSFEKFLNFIRNIIVPKTWLSSKVDDLDKQSEILEVISQTLIDINSIKIIYEENLFDVMNIVKQFLESEDLDNLDKLKETINNVFK